MLELKLQKELGKGVFGTTYLVKKDDKSYALKIQKVLEPNEPNDFAFYKFIDGLTNDEKKYYCVLHEYEFYKCSHKQIREQKFHGKFKKELDKIDSSPWCLYMLTDLKGPSLESIASKKTSQNEIYIA